MAPVEWLPLVALSVLWDGSFSFAKVALAELPPLTVVPRPGLGLAAIDGRPLALVRARLRCRAARSGQLRRGPG